MQLVDVYLLHSKLLIGNESLTETIEAAEELEGKTQHEPGRVRTDFPNGCLRNGDTWLDLGCKKLSIVPTLNYSL